MVVTYVIVAASEIPQKIKKIVVIIVEKF